MTTGDPAARIWALVDEAWVLAATARVLWRDDAAGPRDVRTEAARRVVDAAHVALPTGDAALMFARGLRSELAQMLALADPTADVAWTELDDETLLAQGRASGINVGAVLAPNGPAPAALRQRLAEPDSVFLDIGTGVGAICAAMCQSWPALRCVGIDIAARPLRLAEGELSAAGVQDRVQLRQLDVADLCDSETFDVAWLPLTLISSAAARGALTNVVRAVRPGGWIVVAVTEQPADELREALTTLRAAAVGGGAAYHDEVLTWLAELRISEVAEVRPPAGGPTFLAGMRPV